MKKSKLRVKINEGRVTSLRLTPMFAENDAHIVVTITGSISHSDANRVMSNWRKSGEFDIEQFATTLQGPREVTLIASGLSS